MPVMVISSDEDPLIPLPAQIEITRLAPNAVLRVIEGAGHWPQLEKPDELKALVADFMRPDWAPFAPPASRRLQRPQRHGQNL